MPPPGRPSPVSSSAETESTSAALVLETLQDIIDRTGDAANQASVAERSGLTKKVVLFWMIALSEEGLVDRGPDIDGRAHTESS